MFHILVAEDDKTLCGLMGDYLEENGYQVLRTRDGVQALELLDRNHVDLLICDIMMPKMDGYTLTQELRDAGYTMPILIVTSNESLEDKRQ